MPNDCARCEGTGTVTTPAGRFYSEHTRACAECAGRGTKPDAVRMATARTSSENSEGGCGVM